jgi:hypothetical protein
MGCPIGLALQIATHPEDRSVSTRYTSPPIRVHSPTACVPLRADSGFGRTSREEGRLAKRMNQERLLPTASQARETGPDHIGVGKADVARIKVGRVALRRHANLVRVGRAIARDREPTFEGLRRALYAYPPVHSDFVHRTVV